jgi:hypothetical protein
MLRTQIYLPEDLKLQLQLYAQREAIPVSEVIRKAVVKEIRKNTAQIGSPLAKIAALAVKGGPKDLSTNLFSYLYGNKSNYATKKRKIIK